MTDVPAEASQRCESMQRREFVILRHDHPFLHWDFLIEDGDMLASWRLLEQPEPGRRIPAERLPPHRRHYLTWEGPVSGGRGHVERIHGGWLQSEEAWPDVSAWPGHWFQITDCSPAARCRLVVSEDDQLHWEFS